MKLPLPPPPPPRTSYVRPAFVLVLALIALPIVVLFGVDMVTDNEIHASTRLITALTYAMAVCVAPVLHGVVSEAGACPPATLWRPRSDSRCSASH
jgi:hypothetical protein